jgi:hypothetical protein
LKLSFFLFIFADETKWQKGQVTATSEAKSRKSFASRVGGLGIET